MRLETTDLATVAERLDAGDSIADILDDSEYQTAWTNHHDANPDDHGGLWVKWTGGHWRVIQTTPADFYPDDYTNGRHEFGDLCVYPSDVWETDEPPADHSPDDDPLKGYTDDYRRFAENHHNGPAGPYDLQWVKGAAFDFIGYYGIYHLNGRKQWVEPGDYWSELESRGVASTAYDQLPDPDDD